MKFKSQNKYLLIITMLIFACVFSSCRSAWDDGYDAGRLDQTQKQYSLIQKLNDADHYGQQNESYNIRTYKFPAPTEVDGVKYRAHDITVRSYE